MRGILESYDSELAATEYSPQLSKRLKEAEDILQKTQSHYVEMEVSFHVSLYFAFILCCVVLSVFILALESKRKTQNQSLLRQELYCISYYTCYAKLTKFGAQIKTGERLNRIER